jgi:hypothetical protein
MIRIFLMLAAAAVVSFPAAASAATTTLAPEALLRSAVIRAETNARYRLVPGRRLVVTEATSMGVVGSLTLMTGPLDRWRVVAADKRHLLRDLLRRGKVSLPGDAKLGIRSRVELVSRLPNREEGEPGGAT